MHWISCRLPVTNLSLSELLLDCSCWKLLKDEQMNTAKKSETYDSKSVNLFPAKEEGRVSFLSAFPVPDLNAGLQATKKECFNRTATIIHSQTEHVDKEEDVVRHVLCSPVKPDTSYKRATNPQDVPSKPVTVTPLPQGLEQNKKCNDQLFQARLETTKRKLQDAYLKEKLAKKQRCIKVIEFKDLPKKGYRHKMNDRCCPKKQTNCQAKYTALPIS